MKDLKLKLQLIWIPYLIIAIAFIVLYSLLNWTLFIRFNVFSLKEDILHFWLPFILPWIPALIWLRPRIKLLHFKNDNASFGYQFIATLAIAFPTIVAQEYITTATGKLTALENITQYNSKESTKYYSLSNYFIDKNGVGVNNRATVNGKHNDYLNFNVYVVLPLLNTAADSVKGESSFFISKDYHKRVSNNLSEVQKDEQYKNFVADAQAEFDTSSFRNFVYLEKMGNTDDRDEFQTAVKNSPYVRYTDPVIFKAFSTPFEERNGNKQMWIFLGFGIGALVWFILLLFPRLDKKQLDKFNTGIKSNDDSFKEALSVFIPKEGFYITPILINLNVLIFIVMVVSGLGFISFKGIDLLHWGANYRPAVEKGEWWRLISNVFLHGGFMHVFANMIGLLFVGIFLEPLLGRVRYTLVYLVSGIIGSFASIWWHPATVSIGASGAIFGLYGLFLALLLLKVFPKDFSRSFLVSILFFVVYNLLMGLTGGIDNAAHIGGLVSGLIAGVLLAGKLRKKEEELP